MNSAEQAIWDAFHAALRDRFRVCEQDAGPVEEALGRFIAGIKQLRSKRDGALAALRESP